MFTKYNGKIGGLPFLSELNSRLKYFQQPLTSHDDVGGSAEYPTFSCNGT
jgi:hypothetical protein